MCPGDILNDSRNERVPGGIAELCGELCAFAPGEPEALRDVDILVVSEPHEGLAGAVPYMSPRSFLLVNSDRRGSYRPQWRYKGNLITYGLNRKACITASSIVNDETGGRLQICIQRSFPTLTGGVVAVQEFPVHMHALGAEDVIALVGACMLCGADMHGVDRVFANLVIHKD